MGTVSTRMATPVSHMDSASSEAIKAKRKASLDSPSEPAQAAISCGQPMLARKNWNTPTQPSRKNTTAVRFMVRRVTSISLVRNGLPLKSAP